MIYYVDSNSSWTLIRARDKKAAKSAGSSFFGRGLVKSVRKATPAEINYFTKVMGWPIESE